MNSTVWRETARSIHASEYQLVAAVTGGGSGALAALLQTPGASRTVLEAVVPYSFASLVDWIGGEPDQACSEATARSMAMAAYMRARALAPEVERSRLAGIGCTASLATDRPKRGERRIHVAAQSFDRTDVRSLWLSDESPGRTDDEEAAGAFLLSMIASSCGVDASPLDGSFAKLRRDELHHGQTAGPERIELLHGARRLAAVKPNSLDEHFAADDLPPIRAVFPGAFNPPHVGHWRMAAIAEARLATPVAWELSVANVDKAPLDYIAIADRVAALREDQPPRIIALTRAPRFREKAELFPGVVFIVGADTLLRIAQPKYYGDDATRRDEAIESIAAQGCRFLMFGREVDGRFMTLDDLRLPDELRRLCDEAPAAEFREDVSSSELRAHAE